MKCVTRRGLLGACAVGLAAVSSGCAGATSLAGERTEFDRTVNMATGHITVETDSGNVAVHRTDADAVRLHGVKETASVFADIEGITVEAARTGDHLRITGDAGTDSFLGLGGGSVSLDVGVPEGVAVERVTAGNGDATATGVAGDASLESTNGTVTARNVDGNVSIFTTNGSVRARGIAGLTRAATTNGDIGVDIPTIEGSVSVSTTNGAVTAALAPDLDARVVASTTNGTVTATGLALGGGGRGNSLRGTLGDGTHELTVETTNGDVTLGRLR